MDIVYLCNVKMRMERYRNVLVYSNIDIMFYSLLNIHLCLWFYKGTIVFCFISQCERSGKSQGISS